MWRSQLSEVLFAQGPRYAPVQQGFHHLGLQHAQLQSERGSLHIVQLPLCNACSCKTDVRIIYIRSMIAVSTAVPVRRRIRSEYVCMRSNPFLMKRQSGLEAQCVPFFVGTIQATWYISCVELSQSLRALFKTCLLYTSPSPRDKRQSRMPSSA